MGVIGLSITNDNGFLVSSALDGSIYVFDIGRREKVRSYEKSKES